MQMRRCKALLLGSKLLIQSVPYAPHFCMCCYLGSSRSNVWQNAASLAAVVMPSAGQLTRGLQCCFLTQLHKLSHAQLPAQLVSPDCLDEVLTARGMPAPVQLHSASKLPSK